MRPPRLITLCLAAAVASGMYESAGAHEGHATLPSTGVTVDGSQLLLSPAAVDAMGLQTGTIKLGDVEHALRVNAFAELPRSQQILVTVLGSGRLQQVLVKPGQPVQAGQILARVESLELETLQADLLETASETKRLERLMAQREKLLASGGIAGRTLMETRAQYDQNNARHGTLHRKLQALGLDDQTLATVTETGNTVDAITVVSPINGVVEHAGVRPGEFVDSTTPLFELVDLSTLYVVGEVLESDAFQVTEGLPARVAFVELAEREFAGKIEFVRMKLDESKRTLQVVVRLDNREGRIQPGMFGRMSIEVAAARQAILCPTAALIETDRSSYVLRREVEGRFVRQPVQVGLRSRDFVAIASGLFPGQQVVTSGTHVLAALFDTGDVGSRRSAESTKAELGVRRTAELSVPRIVAAKAVVQLPTGQKGFAMSLVEGRIARIDVRPGQTVQAGEVLGEVESQELHNLQLDLVQSASRLGWASEEAERFTRLAEQGATAAGESWQRDWELATLTRHVASLERRLAMIGLSASQIERLRAEDHGGRGSETSIGGRIAVRAPLTGRIADVLVKPGEIVGSHDSLFEIHDNDSVWVEAWILERDTSRLAPGQDAVVTFPANPHLRVSGRVVRIAPTLTSRERVRPVWIEISNPNGFLKEGMLARVELLTRNL